MKNEAFLRNTLNPIQEECDKLNDFLDSDQLTLYKLMRTNGHDKRPSLEIALRRYVSLAELKGPGFSDKIGYAYPSSDVPIYTGFEVTKDDK